MNMIDKVCIAWLLLQAVFIVIKLLKIVTWSWAAAMSPAILFAVVVVVFTAYAVISGYSGAQ